MAIFVAPVLHQSTSRSKNEDNMIEHHIFDDEKRDIWFDTIYGNDALEALNISAYEDELKKRES